MLAEEASKKGPRVLVLGATGQVGGEVVRRLKADPGPEGIRVIAATRSKEKKAQFEKDGVEAVLLDLDDVSSLPAALVGIDRILLLTGYTVNMLVQSQATLIAAKRAGVKHIVHVGTYGQEDIAVDHMVWHNMIETCIEASGIGWTHLHPNCFMSNFLGLFPAKDGKVLCFTPHKRVGWISLEDLAECAAVVLRQPERHNHKNYWLSVESASFEEIAQILQEVTGKPWTVNYGSIQDLEKELLHGGGAGMFEPTYTKGALEFFKHVNEGKIPYIANVELDVERVIGRPSFKLKDFFEKYKASFLY